MHARDISTNAAPGPNSRRILYIDGDQGFAMLAKFMLESMGHKVTLIAMPELALDALACSPGGWDMVIADFRLDGLTGLELAKAVRDMYPELPCGVISTKCDRETEKAAAAMGLPPVMAKPVALEEFYTLLARIASQVEADSARDGRPRADRSARA